MTQATSRGMFSGCGVGLISSISGLESIVPVSTSTSPEGWSIVQTNYFRVVPDEVEALVCVTDQPDPPSPIRRSRVTHHPEPMWHASGGPKHRLGAPGR